MRVRSRLPTKRVRTTSFFVQLIVFCLLCVVGWFGLQLFRVKTIECIDGEQQCTENIQSFLSGFSGKYIFSVFSFDIPGRTGRIQRVLPHTLRVTIDAPHPVVFVQYGSNPSDGITVYSDGTIKSGESSGETAPFSLADETLLPGTITVSPERLALYKRLQEASTMFPIQSLHIVSSSRIEMRVSDTLEVILSEESLDRSLHSLQQILGSPTIEKKPARVDLRFDHVIVEYL